MRVLVTGGRTFADRAWLWAGLDLLHRDLMPITEIIEGGAPGADCFAAEWSRSRLGKEPTTVDAEWEKYSGRPGKNPAGAIRNAKMADMRPDVVLACPGRNGTANMIETARVRGLNVVALERMPVLPTNEEGGTTREPPSLSAK
jgi:hypothetical protein